MPLVRNQVESAPTLDELTLALIEAVKGKHVVINNKNFYERYLSDEIRKAMHSSSCCMRRFAAARSVKQEGRLSGFNSVSLDLAAGFIGYVWEGPRHRALGDALTCRAVWQYLLN
jgi:DNA polymerase III epsilon subunit-like protein